MSKLTLDTRTELYTDKNCLLKIHTTESSYLHQSWVIDGKVLIYENIPGNYPAGTLAIFDSLEEYLDCIKRIDWISGASEEDIARNHFDKEEHGTVFPFEMQPFYLYMVENMNGQPANVAEYQYDFEAEDIDDAVSYIESQYVYKIDDGSTTVDYENNRAVITWREENGTYSSFAIESELKEA